MLTKAPLLPLRYPVERLHQSSFVLSDVSTAIDQAGKMPALRFYTLERQLDNIQSVAINLLATLLMKQKKLLRAYPVGHVSN